MARQYHGRVGMVQLFGGMSGNNTKKNGVNRGETEEKQR